MIAICWKIAVEWNRQMYQIDRTRSDSIEKSRGRRLNVFGEYWKMKSPEQWQWKNYLFSRRHRQMQSSVLHSRLQHSRCVLCCFFIKRTWNLWRRWRCVCIMEARCSFQGGRRDFILCSLRHSNSHSRPRQTNKRLKRFKRSVDMHIKIVSKVKNGERKKGKRHVRGVLRKWKGEIWEKEGRCRRRHWSA